MVDNVFSVLAGHRRDDDRGSRVDGEHRAGMGDVGLAAEEVDLDIAFADDFGFDL